MSRVEFTDNTSKILNAFTEQCDAALEAVGLAAEGYAKANLTQFPRVDTGRLRSSISHARKGKDEYIGSNVSYASYVELGTGPYAENENGQPGGGRQDVPWFYKDENGVGHLSYGMRPAHFLKRAVTEHKDEYKEIMEKNLKD